LLLGDTKYIIHLHRAEVARSTFTYRLYIIRNSIEIKKHLPEFNYEDRYRLRKA
jgi:hypothetical protein